MKKIVSGEVLQDKMVEAINLLCDTVKTTLGPKGSNVIIDHSNFSPFITNDGVTIAENIFSDDEVINTILTLAKEASLKTNTLVGDGTTTTLVLLQSIFNNGLDLIKKGVNPIILKKELNKELENIITMLKEYATMPSQSDLEHIAYISSNSKEIGKIVSEVYLKVLDKNAITIKEGEDEVTKVNYLKGYAIDSIIPSIYFLNGLKQKVYSNPFILLVDRCLYNLEEVSLVLNEIITKKCSLIIMARDYTEEFVQNIISLNMENNLEILLLKIPGYGLNSKQILDDLKVICNGDLVINKDITLDDLGRVQEVSVDDEKCLFNFKYNDLIKKRVLELNDMLNNTDSEKENIEGRLAMFNKGIAEIIVGAKTVTERREKKMRYDDALGAIEAAKEGIVPGSGLILSLISERLNEDGMAKVIFKKSLSKPLEQILINAGLNYQEIIERIKNTNYEIIYNVKSEEYEKVRDTLVIDPVKVVINALVNATSIASIILTTTSLVINENLNNLNKVIDYNEL